MNERVDYLAERINLTEDGCWLWTRAVTGKPPKDYGQLWFKKQRSLAHRFAYETLVGPIPEGLTIDHLCRRARCVNPDHLEPVTNRENILRGVGLAAQRARQTHCVHGHAFDAANTGIRPDGRRDCRACARERMRRKRVVAA